MRRFLLHAPWEIRIRKGLRSMTSGDSNAKLGDASKAREHFQQALAIHRSAGNQRLLAATLRSLGALHGQGHEFQPASESLGEALAISVNIRDRNGEASALADLASLEMDRGNLLVARQRGEEALSAFESLRLRVMSPKLRATLFASTRRVQELNLEILARSARCAAPRRLRRRCAAGE